VKNLHFISFTDLGRAAIAVIHAPVTFIVMLAKLIVAAGYSQHTTRMTMRRFSTALPLLGRRHRPRLLCQTRCFWRMSVDNLGNMWKPDSSTGTSSSHSMVMIRPSLWLSHAGPPSLEMNYLRTLQIETLR
jgi:hypothetical protein